MLSREQYANDVADFRISYFCDPKDWVTINSTLEKAKDLL